MSAWTRALFVAFLAVVGAFIGSTIWTERVSRGIDADTLLISRDAAPGIEVLSDLRAELRSLELEVLRTIDSGDSSRVTRARTRIDALVARSLALPNDARETALLGKLAMQMRGFDESIERALAEARSGNRPEAHRTLDLYARSLGETAAETAKELIEYDARQAADAADRIEHARLASNRIAFQLDALSAALAVVAAFLAWRFIRQVQQVEAEGRRLIERKAEELEQFAGRVAHDILSPLSAVGMSMTLAGRSSPAVRETLARGTASLARVQGIVDGLLSFARAGARPLPGDRTDVRAVVAGLQEELQPFAQQAGATLKIGEVPDCAVACSRGVLLSLLGNLLRNALKYLGDSTRREVALHIRQRRGRVLFEVEDTGPGIPPALRARMFEPYVRGAHGGTPGIGLGLATVKKLVDSHGGAVGMRPGERGGALFWFELAEAEAPSEPANSLPAAGLDQRQSLL